MLVSFLIAIIYLELQTWFTDWTSQKLLGYSVLLSCYARLKKEYYCLIFETEKNALFLFAITYFILEWNSSWNLFTFKRDQILDLKSQSQSLKRIQLRRIFLSHFKSKLKKQSKGKNDIWVWLALCLSCSDGVVVELFLQGISRLRFPVASIFFMLKNLVFFLFCRQAQLQSTHLFHFLLSGL